MPKRTLKRELRAKKMATLSHGLLRPMDVTWGMGAAIITQAFLTFRIRETMLEGLFEGNTTAWLSRG